jgi:hypothetical protein
MTFLIEYQISPKHRDAAQARFKQTGGMPPSGVKMVARWHRATGGGGFVLAETDSAEALANWTQAWSDLLVFSSITPVVDDETIARVIG